MNVEPTLMGGRNSRTQREFAIHKMQSRFVGKDGNVTRREYGIGRLVDANTLYDDAVFREVSEGNPSLGDTDTVSYNYRKTTLEIVKNCVKDGRPRTISGVITFVPLLKGSFDEITDRFDPQKHFIYVGVRLLSTMKKADASDWRVRNVNCAESEEPDGGSDVPAVTTFEKVVAPGHEDDASWTNKLARDGRFAVIGTGLTDTLSVTFMNGDSEETVRIDEVTATTITGQIVGGLEIPCSLAFTLKDGDTVIGEATVTGVES